mgnify:CR=1 FL=1
MSIRLKIFIAFFLLFIIGVFQLTRVFKDSVRKCYLESLEESMVDTANIMAEFIADEIKNGHLTPEKLDGVFKRVNKRSPDAKIYSLLKKDVDSSIYITDATGIVLYDSRHPEWIGADFSHWNDVKRTLAGMYGARSSRRDPDNPESSIIHVAAPVMINGQLAGVVTYYQPITNTSFFIRQRKNQMLDYSLYAALAGLLVFLIFAEWISWPIVKLTNYVKALSRGERPVLPKMHGGEVARLTAAFEDMREKLDGRKYIEQYVQGLTHELKSPLSAIRGAVEILEEKDISEADRSRFIENIKRENLRMEDLVERLLHLSRLEARKPEHNMEKVDISALTKEVVNDFQQNHPNRNFSVRVPDNNIDAHADKFLVREALSNLLRNAVDFTENSGRIDVVINDNDDMIEFEVLDDGQGIPDYAGNRVFEKFYSLPRPDTGRKSSGLGLSIVKEIAAQHGGSAEIKNRQKQGAKARFSIRK